jgi:hypothetical protein
LTIDIHASRFPNAFKIFHFFGKVTQAAKACSLDRQTRQQIMRRYGILAAPYRH